MNPDDVYGEFERLALGGETGPPVDDTIAGLAVLPADPTIGGRERVLLNQVGATLYRIGSNVHAMIVPKM